MAVEMDFPLNPTMGQQYTSSAGIVYEWNGVAWVVGFYNSATQTFDTIGDILDQIRTLLQDTDLDSGEYRYSDDSLIMNINMAYLEMYRIRPDIFLANKFVIPVFSVALPDAPLVIEQQFIPSLIYYVVGLTQLRDDEPTQDARATAFIGKFTTTLLTAS